MKALLLYRYGPYKPCEFADIPRPTPQSDQILVQVYAAGLNPVDNLIAKGQFKPILPYRLPITMGSDLAGVVVAVGSAVTRFQVGDAVFASTFDLGMGSFAEYVALPESAAAIKPANLSFVEAASLPMVALTSWQALKQRANVQAGQKVFIPAGSGGIGSFAVQLAKHLGATVGTTTSNVQMLRDLGADEIIDYKKQDFEQHLHGYDVVLGTVRGDGLQKALNIVKPNSHMISLIGPPDAAFAQARGMNGLMRLVFGLLSRSIINKAAKQGAKYSFLFVKADGSQLTEIAALLAAGTLKPVIDKVFPFAETPAALAYLDQGRARGKVVVQMVEAK
jgi:NADPH:quinone reductase-like Zn-dependent oxidoreductase